MINFKKILMDMKNYKIIGLMSGTSMDGLDIAFLDFQKKDKDWVFTILKGETVPLSKELHQDFLSIQSKTIEEFKQLDIAFGIWMGEQVNQFIENHQIDKTQIVAIASHGQTLFHQPQHGFTIQVGCGTALAYTSGLNVVNDFRSLDVLAGGQGAPLVPIGDFKLFRRFADSFLNLGGFANISLEKEGKIIAFDIAPLNLPLNFMVAKLGEPYDFQGRYARSGKVLPELLHALNQLGFYRESPPKSLGTEWLEQEFMQLMPLNEEVNNVLRTLVEHQAIQIVNVLSEQNLSSVFITGGGAYNHFLIERIRDLYSGEIIIPEDQLIQFKEALVFGFLAVLYFENETNTLASVTGAEKNLITGVFHRSQDFEFPN